MSKTFMYLHSKKELVRFEKSYPCTWLSESDNGRELVEGKDFELKEYPRHGYPDGGTIEIAVSPTPPLAGGSAPVDSQISGYFSKNDNESIDLMTEFFTRKGIFFIENKNTQEWITENHSLTKDPLKAKQFDTWGAAATYCVKHNFTEPDGYAVTEHEFVDDSQKNADPQDSQGDKGAALSVQQKSDIVASLISEYEDRDFSETATKGSEEFEKEWRSFMANLYDKHFSPNEQAPAQGQAVDAEQGDAIEFLEWMQKNVVGYASTYYCQDKIRTIPELYSMFKNKGGDK